MKVIINADDLGICSTVNGSIFALMADGRVTSATLLVGAPRFDEAVRDLAGFKGCSFGVHLALTDMPSLTSPDLFREVGLTNDSGVFGGAIRQIQPSRALKECIFKEWCAQIEKALDSGVPCSHIDSHHHVHTIPWLFTTLRRVVTRYRVKKVRASMNWYYSCDKRPTRTLLAKKALWNSALRYVCSVKTTDYFCNLYGFLEGARSRFPNGCTIEVMVHPGNSGFCEETELLRGAWKEEMPGDIRLIGYSDL